MNVQVAFKNIESNSAVKEYIDKKLKKLERFLSQIIEIQITLSKEKIYYNSEFIVQVKGDTIKYSEKSEESITASIDKTIDGIERLLSKRKEIIKNHSPKNNF